MTKRFTISTPVATKSGFTVTATMLKSGRVHVAHGATASAANNAAVSLAQDDMYGIFPGAARRDYSAAIRKAANRRV